MRELYQKSLKNACAVSVVALLAMHGAFATTNNGCDKDSNDRINAEIALCSTHVYNIGETENQSSESQKQLMRDVVALKSTVMTQQMYRQYEYLDATLRRFKTQLEKAVLTTKLMAAGADTSSAGSSSYSSVNTSSFRSSDRNIFIAGVSNCNNNITSEKVYECLQTNYNSISNASNNGQNITNELRKQLANDYHVAAGECGKTECTVNEKCETANNLTQRAFFRECLDSLQQIIRKGYSKALQESRKNDKDR